MGGVFWFEMSSATVVHATPGQAFAVVEQAREWARWSGVVVAVYQAPETPWKAGAPLRFRLRIAGRTAGFSVRVTAYDPPSKLAWESTKFTITAVRSLLFEPFLDGTRVTDHKRFSSRVLPIGLVYPRPVIRTMTESWLADVKKEVERRYPRA